MSLRHDSIYDVRIPPLSSASASPSTSSSPSSALSSSKASSSSPPPVLHLRLTEHALVQLAALYSSCTSPPNENDPLDQLQLDLGSTTTDAALVIGQSRLPLQRTSEAAPHEVYMLDADDESHLTRIGSISQKLSVKPSRISSGAATRLKSRQEEEDLRKERKRAVVVDQPITKASIAKRAASAKANALASSSLTRSTSHNKVNLVRDSGLSSRQASPSLLRVRESLSQTSGAGLGSPFSGRASTSAFSSQPSSEVRTSLSGRTRTEGGQELVAEDGFLDSGASDAGSISSPPKRRSLPLDREEGSSRASSATSTATPTRKTGKLTTRQRLAKAAKGGVRILSESDKKASATLSKGNTSVVSVGSLAAADGRAGSAKPAPAEVKSESQSSHQAKPIPSRTARTLEQKPSVPSPNVRPAPTLVPAKAPSAATQTTATSAARSPQAATTPIPPSQRPSQRETERTQKRARDTEPSELPSASAGTARAAPMGQAQRDRRSPPRKVTSPTHPAERDPQPEREPGPKRAVEAPVQKKRRLSPQQAAAPPSLTPSRSPSPHIPLLPTVKGVGPGAAHWLEPWLDVRSRADWHRLAARFSKACEEYTANKRRLDEERRRLEEELVLARQEGAMEATPDVAAGGLGILIHECEDGEAAAASPPRRDLTPPFRGPARDPTSSDSLEEGEMPSDGEERADAGLADVENTSTGHDSQSVLGLSTHSDAARTRSTSPEENLVWRERPAPELSSGADSTGRSAPTSPPPLMSRSTSLETKAPPLSIRELALLMEQHRDLHGCLERMQRTLLEFKGRFELAS